MHRDPNQLRSVFACNLLAPAHAPVMKGREEAEAPNMVAKPQFTTTHWSVVLATADETSPQRLSDGGVQMLLRQRTRRCIEQRAQGGGEAKARTLLCLVGTERAAMEHQCGRHRLAETGRHGEVDTRGHQVAEAVDGQGGVVRNDALRNALLIAAPEGPADQVLVLGGGKVAQAEDAAVGRLPEPGGALIVLLAVGVAGGEGLPAVDAVLEDAGVLVGRGEQAARGGPPRASRRSPSP